MSPSVRKLHLTYCQQLCLHHSRHYRRYRVQYNNTDTQCKLLGSRYNITDTMILHAHNYTNTHDLLVDNIALPHHRDQLDLDTAVQHQRYNTVMCILNNNYNDYTVQQWWNVFTIFSNNIDTEELAYKIYYRMLHNYQSDSLITLNQLHTAGLSAYQQLCHKSSIVHAARYLQLLYTLTLFATRTAQTTRPSSNIQNNQYTLQSLLDGIIKFHAVYRSNNQNVHFFIDINGNPQLWTYNDAIDMMVAACVKYIISGTKSVSLTQFGNVIQQINHILNDNMNNDPYHQLDQHCNSFKYEFNDILQLTALNQKYSLLLQCLYNCMTQYSMRTKKLLLHYTCYTLIVHINLLIRNFNVMSLDQVQRYIESMGQYDRIVSVSKNINYYHMYMYLYLTCIVLLKQRVQHDSDRYAVVLYDKIVSLYGKLKSEFNIQPTYHTHTILHKLIQLFNLTHVSTAILQLIQHNHELITTIPVGCLGDDWWNKYIWNTVAQQWLINESIHLQYDEYRYKNQSDIQYILNNIPSHRQSNILSITQAINLLCYCIQHKQPYNTILQTFKYIPHDGYTVFYYMFALYRTNTITLPDLYKILYMIQSESIEPNHGILTCLCMILLHKPYISNKIQLQAKSTLIQLYSIQFNHTNCLFVDEYILLQCTTQLCSNQSRMYNQLKHAHIVQYQQLCDSIEVLYRK